MRNIDFTRRGLFLEPKPKKEKKVGATDVRSVPQVVLATTAQDRWANYTGRRRFYTSAVKHVRAIMYNIQSLSQEVLDRIQNIPIVQEFRPVDGFISNGESLELLEEAYYRDSQVFRHSLPRSVNKRMNVVILAVFMNRGAAEDTKRIAEVIQKPNTVGRSYSCTRCGRAMLSVGSNWCPSCGHKTFSYFRTNINIVSALYDKYGKAGKWIATPVPNIFEEEVKEGRTFTPDTFDDMEVGLITLVPTKRHITEYT